ncbi:MAG: 23S rRNA pseudouridine synthase [Puniceicoccaceae bacterium 5H]|nr:MAG: 23S rRNA pseudouridine synthase [Puniceicoccaceae bacterium 5H]
MSWSASEPTQGYIGFPEKTLGERPQRLPIWLDAPGFFVLAKPAGVLVQPDPWFPRMPSLSEAIYAQLILGKPELQRLGLEEDGLRPTYILPPSAEGAVVWSKTHAEAEKLRNSYGSEQWTLRFEFVAANDPRETSLFCDLPMARHWQNAEAIVSHKSGKKTETQFERVGKIGRYSLWIAETQFYRLDQICLHAYERGLRVLGDERYGRSLVPMLSDLKRSYRPGRREEQPLWEGPVIRLKEIDGPEETGIKGLQFPASRSWQRVMQVLGRYA